MPRPLSPHEPRTGAGTARETRILRDRQAAYDRAADNAQSNLPPFGSARMLVKVFDGGSIPTTTPRVYFTHPVLVTGSEAEGSTGTLTVDTATTVPVVVLGTTAPVAGDYLTAYAASNRWIAERGGSGGGGSTNCSPCDIPNEDLTISWTNIITGDGSATMTYTPGPSLWRTGCVDEELMFQLQCAGGFELRAIFFIEGECPTGTESYCSNLRTAPLVLTLESYTCTPFNATFSVSGTDCPTLFGDGNIQFFISI